jgi:Domain of unknown function (DUF5069)
MTQTPISPYVETKGMIYFARMLDKIRKHAKGELREDFCGNLGKGFDMRCTGYLRVPYEALRERTLKGGTDEEILEWCFKTGRELSPDDITIWNDFLRKRGWNDPASEMLAKRKQESGLAHRDEIQTMLEYFEYDEGRKS